MMNIFYKRVTSAVTSKVIQNNFILFIMPKELNLNLKCSMCYLTNSLKKNHIKKPIKHNKTVLKEYYRYLHQYNDAKDASKLSETLSGAAKITKDFKQILPKTRLTKKKSKKSSSETSFPTFKVKAIATADYYDLEGLSESLKKSGAYQTYETDKVLPENCLGVKPLYQEVNEIEPRNIFFFEEGTVVFWNTSEEEQNNLLEILKKHENNPHPTQAIIEEAEIINYSRIILNKSTYIDIETTTSYYDNNEITRTFTNKHKLSKDNKSTRYFNNHIYFADYSDNSEMGEKNHLLEKYAFSDAIALSVKLGIWEQNLDDFCYKIEYISDYLKTGKKLNLKNENVLKLLGELFTMRNFINLQSNFLDTPDFYWDREELENLYSQLYSNMSIAKRAKLFNERLDHCIDLMNLLKQHLTDNKHTRLEWIIIGLITIEVLIAFGLLDFAKYLFINLFNLKK